MVKRLGRGRLFSAALGLQRLGFPPPHPRFAQLPSWQTRLLRKLRSGQAGRDAWPRASTARGCHLQRLAFRRRRRAPSNPAAPRSGLRPLKVSSPFPAEESRLSLPRARSSMALPRSASECLPAALGWRARAAPGLSRGPDWSFGAEIAHFALDGGWACLRACLPPRRVQQARRRLCERCVMQPGGAASTFPGESPRVVGGAPQL